MTTRPMIAKPRKASRLEQAFALALKAYGSDLPEPKREYRFHETRKWRFDWAFPTVKLAVEIDGGYFVKGGGRHNGKADREKLAAARAAGWHVLHFTAPELRDSETIIETVRYALTARAGKE